MNISNSFYKRVASIAVPVALHNLVVAAINMSDVFMIGQLGESSVAALGIANQLMFLMIMAQFGIASGTQIFAAQFYGKGDMKGLHHILGAGITIGVVFSMIFAVAGIFFPEFVMSFYSKDPFVIKTASDYLRIAAKGYPFMSVVIIVAAQLRSTDAPSLPLYTGMVSFFVNVFLNWVFIFGKFGFPSYGVEGAAYATIIARMIEPCVLLGMMRIKGSVNASRLSELFGFDRKLLARFVTTSLPVVFNEIVWSFGFTMFSVVYGYLGTAALASINIMDSVSRLSFVALIGVAHAGGVILGQEIGAKRLDNAWSYSKRFSKMAFAVGFSFAILTALVSPLLFSMYKVSDSVISDAQKLLWIWCGIMPVVSWNCLNIVGILRSGGDTRAALFIDIGALWLLAIPLAVIGGVYLNLSVWVVYLMTKSEELVKLVLGLRRYLKKFWLKNIVHDL